MSKKMKKLNVTLNCQAVYNSGIMVPADMDIDVAIKYAKEHIDEIPRGTLDYVPSSDEIDEENCDFDDSDEENTPSKNDSQPEKCVLTKDMIREGIARGFVRFVVDPNMGQGTVCQIGEGWFYFGGMTAEEENPEVFLRWANLNEIVEDISSALQDFNCDEFRVEYLYYYYFLQEKLATHLNDSTRITFAINAFAKEVGKEKGATVFPDDFPHLRNNPGKALVAWKEGNVWQIETLLNNADRIRELMYPYFRKEHFRMISWPIDTIDCDEDTVEIRVWIQEPFFRHGKKVVENRKAEWYKMDNVADCCLTDFVFKGLEEAHIPFFVEEF